jgi:hypothetical protein
MSTSDEIKRAAEFAHRYEQKFCDFVRLCDQAEKSGLKEVIIAEPWVLGDTYEEVIESLHRLAQANLALRIVPK